MARTYNDIYYNDDENSTAEILDDMKKLAESVDQQIGSIKSFNNDTSQFIEQVTPLMNTLSEQVIDMHQLADTMFTELEQVKEENKQLRQDLNGLPKGQASGESIDLNDSAEMRCELKISGNSVQDGEPTPDEPVEVESCGDNINIFDGEVEEGNIDASTGQNAVATNAWRSKNYLNVKDTSVSISVKDLTFSGTVGRLYFYKSDNTYISNILINSLPFTATLPNKTAKVRFFILNSVADINAKIKLEKGSTVTPYSPYGQGCINEVICNKNLVVEIQKGYWNNTGVFDSDNNFCSSKQIKVEPGKTYVGSLFDKNKKYVGKLVYTVFDKNKNFIRYSGEDTITIANNEKYVSLRTYTSQSSYVKNNNLLMQLEEGSTVTPYQECQSQTYTIPTQQPIRSIEIEKNTFLRDTFIKKNNKWYERHYIARRIFNGTENITQSIDGNGDYFYNCYISTNKIWSRMLSSHFKYLNGWGDNNVEESIYWGGNGHILTIKANIDTVDNFKSWLSEQYEAGTPVYVDYILETPLDIECTEEQSTILFDIEQNAKTYDKVTHMYSTDNVSPVIDVTYKKDIETLFANTLVEGV